MVEWTIEHSRARRCKRWSLYPPDVLDLTVAEMDLPTAEPVLASIQDAVDRQAFGYPLPDHETLLPTVTAKWLAGQGLSVAPEQVNLIADVIKGMVLALKHLTPAGPAAVITPTYSRFFDAVQAAERSLVEVPMRMSAGHYALDIAGIERAMRDGARTVLLCNPSNPVGRAFDQDELGELSAVVEHYGGRTISDEVHAPLTYERKFVPYASVNAVAAAHSITLTSASKAWNMPGLRCALMVFTNSADQPAWDALPRASKGGISPLGIEATIAAFTEGQPWLDSALTQLNTNRLTMAEQLRDNGLEDVMIPAEATYLAWLDLRRLGLADPSRYLLDNVSVATTSGSEHGSSGTGFVRVNFATPPNVLTEAMDRIVDSLGGQAGRKRI